jgi:AraC-like DNA-binding protein
MARKMMEEHPERTISDVAERCGFYDHAHFTHIFHKEFGISPVQFQRNRKS